jgi:hypothetical protein
MPGLAAGGVVPEPLGKILLCNPDCVPLGDMRMHSVRLLRSISAPGQRG